MAVDIIENPTFPCSCSIETDKRNGRLRTSIQYCAIHAKAHQMYAALGKIRSVNWSTLCADDAANDMHQIAQGVLENIQ